MIAVHSSSRLLAAVAVASRRWSIACSGRVLGHRRRQGFSGFDFDVHQEVSKVPEA